MPSDLARMREADIIAAERRRAQRDFAAAASRTDAHTREQKMQAQSGASRSRRVVEPLTTQESNERTRRSQATYERARRQRAANQGMREFRSGNREVIDGRGSVDSRAFNELNKLVGYSVDKADRPNPAVDGSNPKTRWHSHAGQGFGSPDSGMRASANARRRSQRSQSVQARGGLSGILSNIPPFVFIAIIAIVVLLVILFVLIFG
jgi:cobalamin biosynthesis Mg chelatase CobN